MQSNNTQAAPDGDRDAWIFRAFTADELLDATCPPIRERAPDAPLLPEIGAVRQWRSELRAGVRKEYTIDALSRAACAEMNGRDALRNGLRLVANDYRERAAEIVLAAAKRSAA